MLNCLNPSGDPKLIEAAARTLNAIFTSPKVSRQELFVVNTIMRIKPQEHKQEMDRIFGMPN